MHIRPYIELVGPAGVGKTHTKRILLALASKRGINLASRKPLGSQWVLRVKVAYKIFWLLLTTPSLFMLYVLPPKAAYKNTPHIQETNRNLITRLIIDVAVLRCLKQRMKPQLVNDEGLVGKLASLSVLTTLNAQKRIKILKKLLLRPALLVFISTSPQLALERESKRILNIPFFHDMEVGLKRSFFKEATSIYKIIRTETSLFNDVQVVRINNNSTPDNLKKEIINLIDILS